MEDDPVPMQDLRLVPLALGLWVGTATTLLVPATGGLRALLVCLGAVLAVLGPAVVGLAAVRRWRGWVVLAVALAAGTAIGSSTVHRAQQDPTSVAAQQHRYAVLQVEVAAPPVALRGFASEDGTATAPQQYRVRTTAQLLILDGVASDAGVQVSVIGTGPTVAELVPGSRIRVAGTLAVDEFPVVPGVSVRLRTAPELLAAASGAQVAAARLRAGLREQGERLGGDAGALLPGLVVGDTAAVDDRLTADAKATGLTHLLAVSGSHFALVCGFVVLLTRRLGPRTAAGSAAVVLLGLVVLVGPQPSVLRAAVMGALTVVAMLLGRTRSAVPALAGAVVVLLIADPSLAVSAGFGLSVVATAGLVLLVPPWTAALADRGWPRGWAVVVAVPVAAALVTAPIIVLLSGAISVVSIPANLLAAPLVAPALVLGLLSALCAPWWPTGAELCADAAAPFLSGIAALAHGWAALPYASLGWPPGVLWAMALAGVLLVGGLVLRFPGPRAIGVAALLGAGVVLVPAQVLPPLGWPPPGWLLVGCQVGQGDAFVMSTDVADTAVVFDTGPEPAPIDGCLRDLGIGTVSLVFITHLHADHVGGLAGVLDGRSVGTLVVGPDRTEPAWSALLAAAARRGVPVIAGDPGTRFSAGDLELTVLGPDRVFSGTASDENNDSLVVRAQRSGVSMLTTGDIEPEAQRAVLAAGVDLDVDVLKVPHHGSSRDLPQFLEATSPQVAMIGVGRDNDYGHPAPGLLAALTAVGVVSVLRTDQDGDVAVTLRDGGLAEVRRGVLAAREPNSH